MNYDPRSIRPNVKLKNSPSVDLPSNDRAMPPNWSNASADYSFPNFINAIESKERTELNCKVNEENQTHWFHSIAKSRPPETIQLCHWIELQRFDFISAALKKPCDLSCCVDISIGCCSTQVWRYFMKEYLKARAVRESVGHYESTLFEFCMNTKKSVRFTYSGITYIFFLVDVICGPTFIKAMEKLWYFPRV